MCQRIRWALPALLLLTGTLLAASPVVEVEVEEVVAACKAPNNGAGPFWCYGAPLLVRQGDLVFASVMETGEGVPLLSNTRWRLFRRDARGWQVVQQPAGFRHREPCPIVAPDPGHLMLSVNPSTEPPGTQYGRCDPHLLRFDIGEIGKPPIAFHPTWPKTARFTDHSYRGIAADPRRGEILVLNIDATTSAQHWAYGTAEGAFSRTGAIAFPIRACYPQVALRDGSAHVLAISDIVEPNEAWRVYKKVKTGRAWDYVFRRLFHTWSPDLAHTDFAPPVEIDTVDATGGHITNLDLWIDPQGVAHLLYLKTDGSGLVRERFFPDRKIVTTLEHVEISKGHVARRTTLTTGGEKACATTSYARFHVARDGRLWVVEAVHGARTDGTPFFENRLLQVGPDGQAGKAQALALKSPLMLFFTATERGGSGPSDTLDLFGSGADGALRYARIRLR